MTDAEHYGKVWFGYPMVKIPFFIVPTMNLEKKILLLDDVSTR